ncbi:hypothetical protein ADL03_06670 [Nocardia sp. NRRL S-836]|nr:hypothetical protein ADL03_06670 [Nocardia sp. NRRL S-836]
MHAGELLDGPRIGLDLTGLSQEARALASSMSDTYDLLVMANNTPAVALGRGDSPEKISLALNRHRAAVVDAELAPLPAPAPNTPVWTVRYYSHGGFVAALTSGGNDAGPHRGWGYAPTPQSAIATVTGFTHHRPPVVVIDPPVPSPVQLAEPSSEADTSVEGQRVRELLLHRGAAYQEHVDACARAAEVLRETDIDAYLKERARLLNDTAPQLQHARILFDAPNAVNRDHRGYFKTTLWVPTRLVVSTDHRTWGDFGGHRPYVPHQIAQGLADATDLDAFTTELFTDEINLTHTLAWAGPVYTVSANGNHRVHIARMLDLPWLATTVTYQTPPPAWRSLSMFSVESQWAKTRRSEKWVQQRQDLIEGLIRRGIVEGEFDDTPDLFNRTLTCTRLPAPWLIRAPELAVAANTYYEALYPGALAMLGIPAEVGTDAKAWARWLTTSA